MSSQRRIIGISGATNTGKSTLCKLIANKYPNTVIINQDDYFREEDDPVHEWVKLKSGRMHQNWDTLSSVNWKALEEEADKLMNQTVNDAHDSKRLLIIEGHLIFNYNQFKFNFEKKFFLNSIDKKTCYERRIKRTYVPADPPGYFEEWVWPMYLKNKLEMQANFNDIIHLDQSSIDEIFQKVITEIESLFTK